MKVRSWLGAPIVATLLAACSTSPQHAPPSASVPCVVGMDVREAVAAMDAQGFCIGTVWRVKDAPAGTVVGQQPAPTNTNVGPGYYVGLEVGGSADLRSALSSTTIEGCAPDVAPRDS